MSLTSSNEVTDIDTPANLVVIVNQAANDILITMGAEDRVVSGPSFKLAVQEAAGSSAAYKRAVKVHDSGVPAEFVQVEAGTPSGILLTQGAVTRRVAYAELLDAVENAINA